MKIAFVFSGQGSQYIGMGKDFYDNFECFKRVFDTGNMILNKDLDKLCFNSDIEELNKTENTQPAILAVSVGIQEILKEKGIKANGCAGFSLGEYSALVNANSIDFKDAINLVQKRAKYMQEAVPIGQGGMVAIICSDKNVVEDTIKEYKDVYISNYNSPNQLVIGGNITSLKSISKVLIEKGARAAIPLKVSGPFHTPLLKSASEKLSEDLVNIDFKKNTIPIISNVTGSYIENIDELNDLLKKQVMAPVKWQDTIEKFINDGYDTFIEIGPGKVLTGFIKKINKSVKTLNIEDLASLNKTLKEVTS